VLRCGAVCCSVLHLFVARGVFSFDANPGHDIFVCAMAHLCCGVLQCVAVCRSVLQCVAVRGSTTYLCVPLLMCIRHDSLVCHDSCVLSITLLCAVTHVCLA